MPRSSSTTSTPTASTGCSARWPGCRGSGSSSTTSSGDGWRWPAPEPSPASRPATATPATTRRCPSSVPTRVTSWSGSSPPPGCTVTDPDRWVRRASVGVRGGSGVMTVRDVAIVGAGIAGSALAARLARRRARRRRPGAGAGVALARGRGVRLAGRGRGAAADRSGRGRHRPGGAADPGAVPHDAGRGQRPADLRRRDRRADGGRVRPVRAGPGDGRARMGESAPRSVGA